MPVYFIILFSLLIYGAFFFLAWKKKEFLNFNQWPKQPTLFRIWIVWVTFLVLLAPLSYHKSDMNVWVTSINNLLTEELLFKKYVYMPIFAQFLSALIWPFRASGITAPIFIIYVVHWFVIFAYVYSANLMSEMLPEHSELAPLGIVIAPVTIFYLFFGTNHIVMWLFLLLSLSMIKKEQWFWSGVFASLSCYKFMLIPTVSLLFLMLLFHKKFREAAWFSMGGLLMIIPSLIYYIYDYENLLKIISHRAAIGSHSSHIEDFHFLFIVNQYFNGFESWYIENQVWFYISLLGIPLSLLLYKLNRLNFFQSLAFSYALVVLFATEPFRLEPLIGLLWLDAVFREDLKVQTAIFSVLLLHATAWYPEAHSRFLIFDPATPLGLWEAKGFYLGVAIMITFLIILFEQDKRELILKFQKSIVKHESEAKYARESSDISSVL